MKSSLVFVALLSTFAAAQDVNISLCVLHEKLSDCNEIKSRLPTIPLQCISAYDRIECMHKVKEGVANVVNLGGNEAYTASRDFKLKPLLEERVNAGDFMYESVAVVKRNSTIASLSDLKGKKSCHTGYGRTAGWDIPTALLMAQQAPADKNCGNDLSFASGFFKESCVPGNWSPDLQLNEDLKRKYANLCRICKQECKLNSVEPYTGYEGALQCLVEKSADVAFTKYAAVLDYMKKNPTFNNNYQLLCSNGSLINMDSNCFWAARPNPLLMVHEDLAVEIRSKLANQIQELFQKATSIRSYLKGTLLSREDSIELRNVSTKDVAEYLLKGNFQLTMDKVLSPDCKETYIHLCVTTKTEKQKCQDIKSAAFANRLRPQIICIEKEDEEECFQAIQNNDADIKIVNALGLFIGTKKYNLKTILEETFPNRSFSHYAVAIVKNNSGIETLDELRGRKACFSSVSDPAGWSIPIATLMKKNLIDSKSCSLNEKVSQFFSDSCAPGALPSFPSLCKLCKGDVDGKNPCTYEDEYAGHVGALKCLAEGGEVAFVAHTGVDQLIAKLGDHSKLLEEFQNLTLRLLCPSGELKFINESEHCNWGRIPGGQVLTNNEKSEAELTNMKMLLIRATSRFSSTSPLFKMFSTYHEKNDVLFSTEANGLRNQSGSAEEILGQELQSQLEKTTCENSSSLIKANIWLIISYGIFLLISNKFL